MAELTADLTGRTAAGRTYVDPSTTYVEQGDGGSTPTALVNSQSDTTADGVLEDLPDVQIAAVTGASVTDVNARLGAIMRNMSELNAKIDAIRTALADANITT